MKARSRRFLPVLLTLLLLQAGWWNYARAWQQTGEAQHASHPHLSLEEIYRDADGDGASDRMGDTVRVSGMANAPSGVYHERYLQIYLQNGATGLSLFAESIDRPVSMGDSLEVLGVVQDYHGLLELEVLDYRIAGQVPLGSLRTLPLDTVYANPGRFLGMQVAGTAVVVGKGNRYNGKYLTLAPGESGNRSLMFYVTNFHRNYASFDFERVSIGDRVRVAGVVNRYTDPNRGGYIYSLFPRTTDDFAFTGIPRHYLLLGALLLGGVLLAVGAWIVSLRRQVLRKTRSLEEAVDQRDALFQEIHHRVKNNLAVISGLIDLQMDGTRDESARRVLRDSQKRIQSMALVHDKLYRSDAVTAIGMEAYVRDLVESIRRTFAERKGDVRLVLEVEDLDLDMRQVIPCGLLINELAVNAFKHAFLPEHGEEGVLTIRLEERDGAALLVISDNGPGLPEDFDLASSDSLGMILVQTFARQLSAEMEVNGRDGTAFRFTFPLEQHASVPTAPAETPSR
ncbi:MAG: sensor histidine kinase [Balneolaceae bacterium]|nr:sensor histidine kinase [Balneolaceae bacterium]